jgi:hypothetical protein
MGRLFEKKGKRKKVKLPFSFSVLPFEGCVARSSEGLL